MSNLIDYSRVLRAAAIKGEGPALIADSVQDAAHQYAYNGSHKVHVQGVIDACTLTSAGKPRTPAANTLTACILSTMQGIMMHAPAAGARPAGKEGPDHAARLHAATVYAVDVRAEFVAALEASKVAREAKRAEKATVNAKAPETGAPETGAPEADTNANIEQSDALESLMKMSDAELLKLATLHPGDAQRLASILALAQSTQGAAGELAKASTRKAKKTKASPLVISPEAADPHDTSVKAFAELARLLPTH